MELREFARERDLPRAAERVAQVTERAQQLVYILYEYNTGWVDFPWRKSRYFSSQTHAKKVNFHFFQ